MKGATKKTNSQEEGLLDFLALLMKGALPLIKNVITPLAKYVLIYHETS